ncbi:MAG TPA: transcriptional regulator [Candidatus Saccharimonadales bacterium]|jgi:hypothetical protein
MIEQLFGSKTRVKLLQLFYSNPNRSFYVREITRKIDEQINSVRRELANLLSIGIIVSDNTNNKLYYEVNQKYEYFDPLTIIFGAGGSGKKLPAQISIAISGGLPAATEIPAVQSFSDNIDIKTLGNVEIAVYTGQFTRDESTGVDVFLVGDINTTKLQKFMADLESKEGKELRYTMMSLSDFQYRQQIKDRFVSNVMRAKKQVIIDKHASLKA